MIVQCEKIRFIWKNIYFLKVLIGVVLLFESGFSSLLAQNITAKNIMNSESGTFEFCFKTPVNLDEYTNRYNGLGIISVLNPDAKDKALKKPLSVILFCRGKQKKLGTMAYITDKKASLKRIGKSALKKGDDQWHRYAITWDKGVVESYLDGRKLQTESHFFFDFAPTNQIRLEKLHFPVDELRISAIARDPESLNVNESPLVVDEFTTLLLDMEPVEGKKDRMRVKYCSDGLVKKEIPLKSDQFVSGIHGKAIQHGKRCK